MLSPSWANVPAQTATFSLILRDLDTPLHKGIVDVPHWVIFNIPSEARELPEGVAAMAQLTDGSVQLLNQTGKIGYMGMAAPASGPYHHYTFELFALDTKLNLGPNATEADILKAMDGHIFMKSVLVGCFHFP